MSNISYQKKAVLVLLISFLSIILFLKYNENTDSAKSDKEKIIESGKKIQLEDITYIHPDNTFKLNFPGDLKYSNLAEDNVGATNETIIFSSNEPETGFQIFISSYFGDAPLGIDMIIKGNPDLEISNSMAIDVAGGKAISFLAKPVGADFVTREVWLTHDGKLYQVSTFTEFEEELNKILATWEWASV